MVFADQQPGRVLSWYDADSREKGVSPTNSGRGKTLLVQLSFVTHVQMRRPHKDKEGGAEGSIDVLGDSLTAALSRSGVCLASVWFLGGFVWCVGFFCVRLR